MRHPRPALLCLALLAALALAGPSPAAADQPWWHVASSSRPSYLPPAGEGTIVASVENFGDLPASGEKSPVKISDVLPAGLEAKAIVGAQWFGNTGTPLSCELATLTCTLESSLAPYQQMEMRIRVEVEEGAESGQPNRVSVSGGGAPPASAQRPVTISEEAVPFGVQDFELRAEEEGGPLTTQAGSHPFQVTGAFVFNQGEEETGATGKPEVSTPGLLKDIDTRLPPGLLGDPTPLATCTIAQFTRMRVGGEVNAEENDCPSKTAIGAAAVTVEEPGLVGYTAITVPVFNLEPAFGEPARFGFALPISGATVILDTALRSGPGEDYGVTVSSLNTTEQAATLNAQVSFWGVPGDSRHDSSRGWACLFESEGVQHGLCVPSGEQEPPAFLSLPTACSGPLEVSALVSSWAAPGEPQSVFPGEPLQALDGCNRVPFSPVVHAEPTSKAAGSATGLNFAIDVADEGLTGREGLAQSQIKKAVVTLPEGLTIDASLAEGLHVCSEAEYEAATTEPGTGCREDSKIGEAEVESPLVESRHERVLKGGIYVAEPENNPYRNLTTLYLIMRAPELGVVIRQALKVTPDPQTGQLVTEVDNIPQLPFSHLRLDFRTGQRAPLITPPYCGTYAVKALLYPWSAPGEPIEESSPFQIDGGPEGKPCPSGPAPFAPGFEAGSLNNQAGSYSPFVLKITRRDGEQDITKFSSVLPPGMVGKIAGVAKCPQASVEAAKHLSGRSELASPSCPASSLIGSTLSGAGVGSTLVYVPGKLYLGGPYHGDPLSVVAIVPAVAGPFDVGDVVVQEALTLNPVTGEVEVDGSASDPIPHSLAGIPLNVRDIRVFTDRPEFTLNPTNCDESSTRATLWGGGTALHPGAEVPLGLSHRFQAAGCASLGFKPQLGLKLKGGTKRGQFPALHAVYTPKAGDANLSRLALRFPRSAFIEQGHFRTICTRVQFNAGAGHGSQCPKGSVYGHAKVWTPLLDGPLSGPVMLRSSNHNLPDAIFVLHGPPSAEVNLEVSIRIDSVHGHLRATVENSPDAPVTRAIVDMQGGRKGLFVNSPPGLSNTLCGTRNVAHVSALGQNGRRHEFNPLLKPRCGKAKRKGHGKQRKRGGGR